MNQNNRVPNSIKQEKGWNKYKANRETSCWNINSVEREVKKHKTLNICWQPG